MNSEIITHQITVPSVTIGEVVNVRYRHSGFVFAVDPMTRKTTEKPQAFEMSENGGLIPTDKPATRTIEVQAVI